MNEISIERLDIIERYLLLVIFILPVTMVAILIMARWPEYWVWIARENTPMTSLEVTVMYTTALCCWASAATNYIQLDNRNTSRWLVMGIGFLFLTMDDRFAIHERIRDGFLVPLDISIPLLPVGVGDFILLIYMIVGLIMLKWMLPILSNKRARNRFLAGVVVAVLAVIFDAYDVHRLSVSAQRLEQTIEEILELIAQIFFLQGVIMSWFVNLKKDRDLRHLNK